MNGSVCLDGTPGMYYHRPGTGSGSHKWFIYHQGGGWCTSLQNCMGRSKTDLGSSRNYPSNISATGGFFSMDPSFNPLMYNWNMVYFKYCDGNSFSGNNSTATTLYDDAEKKNVTLFFRGKHILLAGMADLLGQRGMNQATDVVISGCSAGGLSTYLHCDTWAENIRNATQLSANTTGPKIVCMPDSGLFLDYEGPPHYHSSMVWAFHQHNASVHPTCLTTEKPASNCMFAQHTMKYLETPVFALQSGKTTG